MSDIHVDIEGIEELYQFLHEEKDSINSLVNTLSQFKTILEAQRYDTNSLQQVFKFTDSLINVMEILSNNIVTLQTDATLMSEQFSEIDKMLATKPVEENNSL